MTSVHPSDVPEGTGAPGLVGLIGARLTDSGLDAETRAVLLEALGEDRTPDTARRWSTVWVGLGRTCHHHGYELSPTPAESQAWREKTERLLAELPVTSTAEPATATAPK